MPTSALPASIPFPEFDSAVAAASPQIIGPWPILAGVLCLFLLIAVLWMQRRYRGLHQSLEGRIVQRTAQLRASEERARILVDHAPEAIVVLDGETGRFIEANENAARLYGLELEELLRLSPVDLSPERQPDGSLSAESARDRIQEALKGRAPVFEWTHRHSSGCLIPCEIRLVRLPSQDRRLVRGSVIDNTDRRRREAVQSALYQISEAIHTTENLESLYQRIHTIIRGLMAADNFYIALYDSVTHLITFPYHCDETERIPDPREPGPNLTDYVIETGRPLLADQEMMLRRKPLNDPVAEGSPARYVTLEAPAAIWLGVPLIVRGRTIGAMAVQDYRNAAAYGEEEKQILNFVAEQTALAIERKRAEQSLLRRNAQIRRHRNVLLELAQLDKSDFQSTLQRICELSAVTLDVARVSYWSLRDGHSAIVCELLFLRDSGQADAAFKGTTLHASDCPEYFRAVVTKRPIVAGQARHHPATSALAESYLKPLGITSMLDAPVWIHGQLLGVLCHEHIGLPREWTVEEIDFASSLATMISLASEAAERARSEAALRESEEKHRALFEATSQGVLLHDQHQFLEVNPAAVRILGFERAEDILGKHPADTSAPIQPNGEPAGILSRKYMEECLTQGSARFEWLTRNPRGEDVPIEVLLTRIPMGGRHLIQAVIHDITERKQTETELLKALAREKELSQLKSNFVSMVSHEFRTPLGIIMSSADILQTHHDELDPSERRDQLDSIHKNIRRMAALMEEVLFLGQVEAGKLEFKPVPIDLHAFCSRLVDEVNTATHRRCPIEFSPENLPAGAFADERLLNHILLNLLSNAVKYSHAGSPVKFSIRRDDTFAVCAVRDSGIGIPEADRSWLFNAFHRGRNVGHRPGTGLGLVIVKRCVELHGGTIEVESSTGEGTTVIVRLPVFPPVSQPQPIRS